MNQNQYKQRRFGKTLPNFCREKEYWEKKEEEEKIRKDSEKEEIEEDEDLKEEIIQIIRKMKKKKAAGLDRIIMEAWLYGGKALRKRLVEIMKEI